MELIRKQIESDNLYRSVDLLCSSYSGDLREKRLWTSLSLVLPKEYWYKDVSSLSEKNGFELANELIMQYGRGEKVVKYHLAKQHIDDLDEVSLFEMKVCNSRLDYARINGSSYVYEIKTENDSVIRLEKQLKDYELIFEFIYIVVHAKHLEKVLTLAKNKIGIISYELKNGEYVESLIRPATKNKSVQKKATVEQLTGDQLKRLLIDSGFSASGKNVEQLRNKVMKVIPKQQVLMFFKESVKKRYKPNWDYTRENFGRIHPIDLQTVYSKWEYWVEIRGGSSFRLNDGVE